MSHLGLDANSVAEAIPQKSKFRNRPRTRKITLLLAIVFSSAIYFYFVNLYAKNFNLISQIWQSIVQQDYDFYSGLAEGFYTKVGKQLQEYSKNGGSIRISNKESTGGYNNSLKVMNDSRSFGLVQEDTVMEGDFIRKHIRYITPLYLERMHVIYRLSRFKELSNFKPEEEVFPYLENLKKNDDKTKMFFKRAEVSTGPSGSGTKVIANYLLSQCNIKVENDNNLEFSIALEKMKKKEIDITFVIAGAPLEGIQKLLEEDQDIRLMSVNPALFLDLNSKFNLRLRTTTFRQIYAGCDDVTTIGSYAFLICSPKIPNAAIMKVIKLLQKYKEAQQNTKQHFPLNEFDFYNSFKMRYEGFLMECLRNIIIFLITVSITSTGVYTFLVWLISGMKRVAFFKEITRIYSSHLPENTELNEGNIPYPIPIIYDNQAPIIRKLILGMKDLLAIAKQIREKYKDGGITSTHYKQLLINVYYIRDIIQRNLAQRLNEVIETGFEISASDLRQYYTAGYIPKEHYRELADLLNNKRKNSKTESKNRKSRKT